VGEPLYKLAMKYYLGINGQLRLALCSFLYIYNVKYALN